MYIISLYFISVASSISRVIFTNSVLYFSWSFINSSSLSPQITIDSCISANCVSIKVIPAFISDEVVTGDIVFFIVMIWSINDLNCTIVSLKLTSSNKAVKDSSMLEIDNAVWSK